MSKLEIVLSWVCSNLKKDEDIKLFLDSFLISIYKKKIFTFSFDTKVELSSLILELWEGEDKNYIYDTIQNYQLIEILESFDYWDK